MSKEIEIPFGAKDSELKGWEYTIPENMEAEIKDGKVIVKQKESEDERLRRLLVWQVHRNIENETNDLAGSVYDGIKGHDPDLEESIEDWKKCLAYLERQKEQKPAIEEVLIKAGLKSFKDGNQWCVLVGDNIQEGVCGFGDTIEDALYEFLKEVCEQQKPAEWSLTDATFIEEIDETLFMAEAGRNEVVKNQIERERNWLKSLQERFNFQPKIEWSKEDKRCFDEAIEALESLGFDGEASNLKSLRDNYKKCNSRWKPSDEQMAALLNAEGLVRANNYPENAKILASLYEDLKKL